MLQVLLNLVDWFFYVVGIIVLYTFFFMYLVIISNYNSSETFEEVQFFNGNNYYKGLDWFVFFNRFDCFQIFCLQLCFCIVEIVFFLLVSSIFDGDDFYFFFRYMNFFFISLNVILDFLFEKSVIYFDSELVSYRVYVFLFKVKFICIFVYSVKRVYFWYQVYLISVIQLYMEI